MADQLWLMTRIREEEEVKLIQYKQRIQFERTCTVRGGM